MAVTPTKANVSRPRAFGYDVLVEYGDAPSESLYLRAAVGPGRTLAFQTVEPEQRGPVLAENPEDMRSVSGSTFSRSDFTGGMGLRRAHRRGGTDADWSRFWRSEGVDTTPLPTGEPTPLRLLPSVSVLRAGSSEGVATRALVANNGFLFAALGRPNGRTVSVTENPLAANPTWTDEDATAGDTNQNVISLLAHDEFAYAAFFDGHIHRRFASQGASWQHYAQLPDAQRIWSVKRRVLAATTQGLYEVRQGNDSVLVHSASPDDYDWRQVTDGGSIVLAAHRSAGLLHFAEEEGELVLVGQTPLPAGEEPMAVGAAYGTVLLVTGEMPEPNMIRRCRMYRGAVVGNRVVNLQIIHEWEPPVVAGLINSTVGTADVYETRDALWYPALERNSNGTVVYGIYRYDLATGSLHRHCEFPTVFGNDECNGFLIINNRLFFKCSDLDLYRSNTTYRDSGWLILPIADFYNDETKTWADLRLRLRNMGSGTRVSLAYSTDPQAVDTPNHSSWVTAINQATAEGEHVAELIGVESRWLALKVTLATTNSANTPEVLSAAARALLKPSETDYQVPINVSDRVEIPRRKPMLIPGLGEQVREWLNGLVGKRATVTILHPRDQIVGQIRAVSEPIQEIPERGSPSVYALLTIRGRRVPA